MIAAGPAHLRHVLFIASALLLGTASGGGAALAGPTGADAPGGGEGLPPLRVFTARDTGLKTMAWSAAQDRGGTMYFGCDTLVSFDGDRWHSADTDQSYAIRGLDIGPNGRIWVGGVNQIGWFESVGQGRLEYHSLMARLPALGGDLGEVWKVFAEGNEGAVFVAREKILRWDGRRFLSWDYPGAGILWATRTETSVYFHYPPLGLMKLGAGGALGGGARLSGRLLGDPMARRLPAGLAPADLGRPPDAPPGSLRPPGRRRLLVYPPEHPDFSRAHRRRSPRDRHAAGRNRDRRPRGPRAPPAQRAGRPPGEPDLFPFCRPRRRALGPGAVQHRPPGHPVGRLRLRSVQRISGRRLRVRGRARGPALCCFPQRHPAPRPGSRPRKRRAICSARDHEQPILQPSLPAPGGVRRALPRAGNPVRPGASSPDAVRGERLSHRPLRGPAGRHRGLPRRHGRARRPRERPFDPDRGFLPGLWRFPGGGAVGPLVDRNPIQGTLRGFSRSPAIDPGGPPFRLPAEVRPDPGHPGRIDGGGPDPGRRLFSRSGRGAISPCRGIARRQSLRPVQCGQPWRRLGRVRAGGGRTFAPAGQDLLGGGPPRLDPPIPRGVVEHRLGSFSLCGALGRRRRTMDRRQRGPHPRKPRGAAEKSAPTAAADPRLVDGQSGRRRVDPRRPALLHPRDPCRVQLAGLRQ